YTSAIHGDAVGIKSDQIHGSACLALMTSTKSRSPEDGMKIRIFGFIAALTLFCLLGSTPGLSQNAYITTSGSNTVSVIDTATDAVTATISVGHSPLGVAVTQDGSKVYVANTSDNAVSVITTATDRVTTTIPVGIQPRGVAVTPDGGKVYVANQRS